MSFLDEINDSFVAEAKKITMSSFMNKVSDFSSLDDALSSLPDDYLEFYANNEKALGKAMKKMFESAESPGYIGYAPLPIDTTKVIKYKGQIIKLTFDAKHRIWTPQISFRNITEALKFSKEELDKI